eukprot:342905-Alexandrium_andersonii.AAC.1
MDPAHQARLGFAAKLRGAQDSCSARSGRAGAPGACAAGARKGCPAPIGRAPRDTPEGAPDTRAPVLGGPSVEYGNAPSAPPRVGGAPSAPAEGSSEVARRGSQQSRGYVAGAALPPELAVAAWAEEVRLTQMRRAPGRR